eukprot:UN19177
MILVCFHVHTEEYHFIHCSVSISFLTLVTRDSVIIFIQADKHHCYICTCCLLLKLISSLEFLS